MNSKRIYFYLVFFPIKLKNIAGGKILQRMKSWSGEKFTGIVLWTNRTDKCIGLKWHWHWNRRYDNKWRENVKLVVYALSRLMAESLKFLSSFRPQCDNFSSFSCLTLASCLFLSLRILIPTRLSKFLIFHQHIKWFWWRKCWKPSHDSWHFYTEKNIFELEFFVVDFRIIFPACLEELLTNKKTLKGKRVRKRICQEKAIKSVTFVGNGDEKSKTVIRWWVLSNVRNKLLCW